MATRRVAALIGSSIGKIDKSDVLVDGDILVYNATTTKWDTKQMSASAAFVEAAQDAVAAMVVDSAEIDFTYVDATPSLTGVLINGSVAYARIVNASALSILGRSANSIGVLADIAAGADDRILRRTASTINFGQLTAGMFPALVVPDAALSTNVPLLNLGNHFLADQTVTKSASRNTFTLENNVAAAGSIIRFITNSVTQGFFGASGGEAFIAGMVNGDIMYRAEAGKNTFSCDAGATAHFSIDPTESVAGTPVRTKGYTVATLPAGVLGQIAHVTDALAPAFLTAVVGGGAVKSLVFFNGANWVAA